MDLPALAAERRTPAEIDQAALSLASSRGVEVSLQADLRFPQAGPSYAAGWRIEIRATSPAAPAELAAEFEQLLAAAPTERIEEWLALLQAVCARRSEDDSTASVVLALYTRAMGRFPADVVRFACAQWAERPSSGPNWFPTLGELVDVCERLSAKRRNLVGALKHWRPPTRAERLEAESDRLMHRATLEEDLWRTKRRGDPGAAAEHEQNAREARRQAKALRIEARAAQGS